MRCEELCMLVATLPVALVVAVLVILLCPNPLRDALAGLAGGAGAPWP
jgi:hypothetical protein